MNPKIVKVIQDIDKTCTKISELQALLPQLERKKIELENEEIIRRVRKASITAKLGDLESVLETIKQPESSITTTTINEADTSLLTRQDTQESAEITSKD